MRLTDDENEFYEMFGEIMRKSSPEELIFASKTPVIFLPNEIYNQARKNYYESFCNAVQNGLFKAAYMFAINPTSEELSKYYSKDQETKKYYGEHLEKLRSLLTYDKFQLRAITSENFNSCLLGNKIGAIHFKEPGSLETKLVAFVEGRELDIFRSFYMNCILKNTCKVTENDIEAILKQAKKITFSHQIEMAVRNAVYNSEYMPLPQDKFEDVFNEMVKYRIVISGSMESYSVEKYTDLKSNYSKFDIFIDEKAGEVFGRGKKVRLKFNTIYYKLLKLLVQLPGRSILYKDIYNQFWGGHRETTVSGTVLTAKRYLNGKCFNIIDEFIFSEGDKFSIDPNFYTCLIESILPSINSVNKF